jgi:hypothetical protein
MWRLYGWFTCLMCLGCIAGAVAWAAYMQYLAIFFAAVKAESIKSAAWFQRQQAAAGYWNAAFLVVYPFEFLLLSVTKLLVLDRMIFFAAAAAAEPSPSSMERTRQEPRPGRLALAGRIVMIAVVAGDCIGIFGNVASAVYWVQGADRHSEASAAFAGNLTTEAAAYLSAALQKNELGEKFSTIQKFSEVVVLLLIVVAFAVVAAVCSRRITAAVNCSADLAAAQRVRLQILGTAAVVFVTFLLRSVFSIMFAVADALQNDSEADCSGLCDGCKNVYAHIQAWVHYTPVFRLCIILISSPLALLVALWGMTSDRTLQLMRLKLDCWPTPKNSGPLLPLSLQQYGK